MLKEFVKLIRVESRKLGLEDCRILADITMSARKDTPLESKKTVEEMTNSIVRLSEDDGFQILVAVDSRKSIVGWTYDYVAFPLMTFISGFFPLTKEPPEREAITLALIEASKRKITEHHHSRLELELEFPTEDHRTHAIKLIELYKKCGFQFAAEEVRMHSNLSTIEFPKLEYSPEFTLKGLSEVSYDQLEKAGFQVFEDSKDDLFLSTSHAEQKVTLEHYFDKSEAFIEEATFILMKNDEIIGFIICRERDNETMIKPIGVIPESRGQGLANYLLVNALKNLKDIGISKVCLDVSVSNLPARNLYKKHNFSDVSFKQFYYWSP